MDKGENLNINKSYTIVKINYMIHTFQFLNMSFNFFLQAIQKIYGGGENLFKLYMKMSNVNSRLLPL
jgi:hypothetical protein